jgi:hypothetical protein
VACNLSKLLGLTFPRPGSSNLARKVDRPAPFVKGSQVLLTWSVAHHYQLGQVLA